MTGPTPEDDLIARHFAPWAAAGANGLKDDAAIWRPKPDWDLVITTDAIVAGVHFLPDDPPDAIAVKALAVNLSDLAAKGADPAAFLLTLILPRSIDDAWLTAFSAGLRQASDAAKCVLLGGDTTSTPGPLTLSITAFGEVPKDRAVTRLTAKAGETIAVSGTIGDGALGLKVLTEPDRFAGLAPEHRDYLIGRYRRPQARVALASVVRDHASAAMDVSDGLVGDLAKLLRASGVNGRLDIANVPLSDAARAAIALDPSLLDTALTGGDDYEIVLTVPPDRLSAIALAADAAGVTMTAIGTVSESVSDEAASGGNLACIGPDGTERGFARGSFSHF